VIALLDRSLLRLSDRPLARITLERLRWFWLDSLFANSWRSSGGWPGRSCGRFMHRRGAENA